METFPWDRERSPYAGAHDAKFAKGRIAFQHAKGLTNGSGVAKFHKVQIKPL